MTDERANIVAREEEDEEILLQWLDMLDLPTIHANRLFISHAGREFLLIFGEVTPPVEIEPTPEQSQESESTEIKPVAKIFTHFCCVIY